nr:uncharacterized protein LOC104105431 [Nicotiana tomentosiformis]XP_009612026.1 uncharacterized protein LOC104105431 [Nicotiana tomentosiformis]XP_018629396.1 uncharacterized protein LOC104105431 [Nicotiana tomentosiformis]XP_018629397.1 uncharacterized protein LOC104105431 [Nicotiana tomentosiformis]XP_033514371.1 uncharacterized protein LOC104105431 [Nicotiana tomentosiformis]
MMGTEVFDRLGIDPSDKVLQFTVKFDRAQLIRLRDQEGVDTLLQFNDGFAHVYASTSEESNFAVAPNMDTTRVSTTEVEAVSPGSVEEDLLWFLEKLKLVVQNREVVIVSGTSLPFLSRQDLFFPQRIV